MNIIADFNWNACGDCKHSDPKAGGCAVNTDQWEAALIVGHDFIVCGSYESREAVEPISSNVGPALPGLEL